MRQACLILCVLCVVQSGPADPRARLFASETPANARCGGYCLFVALKSFGLGPDSYADLERQLGAPGASGYSMAQLQACAGRFGLETRAVSTTLEHLADRGRPLACIAHLKTDHFVLLADITPEGVRIVDPPGDTFLPQATWLSQWDGNCLLLSPVSLESEEAIVARKRNDVLLKRLFVFAVVSAGVVTVFALVRRFRSRTAV